MVQIYRLNQAGGGEPLSRILCSDEGQELQFALEQNFDLLPGDQIRPEDPCRWNPAGQSGQSGAIVENRGSMVL
jgi:hypothetical protein